MQDGNFTIHNAGIKDCSPIVYNGISYDGEYALFGLSMMLVIPSNSPMRVLFDQHNKVIFTFKVEDVTQFTVIYNYHTVNSGTRQHRNDQFPNVMGTKVRSRRILVKLPRCQ